MTFWIFLTKGNGDHLGRRGTENTSKPETRAKRALRSKKPLPVQSPEEASGNEGTRNESVPSQTLPRKEPEDSRRRAAETTPKSEEAHDSMKMEPIDFMELNHPRRSAGVMREESRRTIGSKKSLSNKSRGESIFEVGAQSEQPLSPHSLGLSGKVSYKTQGSKPPRKGP